jgi:endonuclease/exonuclease/phosphatase family metal-dependent hydrolase
MKLVTLNLWGGRTSDRLPAFFCNHPEVDIWCFQEMFKKVENMVERRFRVKVEGFEVDHDLYGKVESLLDTHEGKFCQCRQEAYGIATFIKKDIEIMERGEILVARGDWEDTEHEHSLDHHRKIQWFELRIVDKRILLVNTHLTHRPEGKGDSEKRLKQSKIIVDFLEMFDIPKILVGDFNLMPDTESIHMIEKSGMRNLIVEHGITSTRTELYKKELRMADYIFVSPEIKVINFRVLSDVVSDHNPLLLDFDLQ